jgi:hypothetical protein
MHRKPYILTILLLFLAGILVYLNRDWFRGSPIQISHRLYRFSARFNAADDPIIPVMFEFDRKLKLTSIKVFALAEIATNKVPHPLWHMISDSNSVPTKGFVYGLNVPGMRPARKGLTAQALDPTEKYRLQVEAGRTKALHDFTLDPGSQ